MQQLRLALTRRLPIVVIAMACAIVALASPRTAAGQAIPRATATASPTMLVATASVAATVVSTPMATPSTSSPPLAPTVAAPTAVPSLSTPPSIATPTVSGTIAPATTPLTQASPTATAATAIPPTATAPVQSAPVRTNAAVGARTVVVATEPFPFASIASGDNHTCGLTANGTAFCWGVNYQGQLGDGTTFSRNAPVAIGGGLRFETITAGSNHTCAISTDSLAYCWGQNADGQLGDGTTTSRLTPTRVTGAPAFTSIVAGSYHTCGLTAAGTAWCWGDNVSGQLGDGFPGTDRLSPVAVLGARSFVSLAAGGFHTCGLTAAGTAWCWGSNAYGQIGDGTSGFDAWDHAPRRSLPVTVRGGISFASLTAGNSHTCGLTTGGGAFCWGSNFSGQLGDGTGIHEWFDHATDRTLPVAVIGGRVFTKVSAHRYQTCGVITSGDTYCWGERSNAKAFIAAHGSGTTSGASPIRVDSSVSFISISPGDRHACALTVTGMAYCWGSDGSGQLGDGPAYPDYYSFGSTDYSGATTPVAVVGGEIALETTTANNDYPPPAHTCGLTIAGLAYCWGANASGQLGDGTTTTRTWAVAVNGGLTFRVLVAGGAHTCGLTLTSGTAYCWGNNASGQLGDGTQVQRLEPTATSGARAFQSISAGSSHTCALTSTGQAWCWGQNTYGQVGDGTTIDRSSPVAVATTLTFSYVSASGTGTFASSGGTAYGWGTATTPASSVPKVLPSPAPPSGGGGSGSTAPPASVSLLPGPPAGRQHAVGCRLNTCVEGDSVGARRQRARHLAHRLVDDRHRHHRLGRVANERRH